MTSTQDAGRKGGQKTATRGSKYYRDIQKKSVESRRKNRLINRNPRKPRKPLQDKEEGI